jgi:hypothetical protein
VYYPRDLVEFDQFFPTEESCRRYLEQVRRKDGFVCRVCGRSDEPWRVRRREPGINTTVVSGDALYQQGTAGTGGASGGDDAPMQVAPFEFVEQGAQHLGMMELQ